jgi:tartrate-resistant acid phosphatase type 5
VSAKSPEAITRISSVVNQTQAICDGMDFQSKAQAETSTDYGWTGWRPNDDHFCYEILPKLEAAGITIPREVQNDCDPGDRMYIANATAFQMDTSAYIGQICAMKNCSAFISVGDNFYDSGIDFTTGGILRFQEAWVDMYSQGVFEHAPWYQCLGNHDIVKGQSGVDFQTKVAPIYDSRWYFVSAQRLEKRVDNN